MNWFSYKDNELINKWVGTSPNFVRIKYCPFKGAYKNIIIEVSSETNISTHQRLTYRPIRDVTYQPIWGKHSPSETNIPHLRQTFPIWGKHSPSEINIPHSSSETDAPLEFFIPHQTDIPHSFIRDWHSSFLIRELTFSYLIRDWHSSSSSIPD